MTSGISKADRIYLKILSKLRSGEWPAGSRLRPETQMAADFRVAPMTLRRALERLVQEGLISRRPRHGTFVNAEPTLPKKGGVKRVGVIVPDTLSNLSHPVFSRLVQGIEKSLREQGRQQGLVFGVSKNWPTACSDEELCEMIAGGAAAVWLVPCAISPSVRAALIRSGLPCVLMHQPDPELSPWSYQLDYRSLYCQVFEHLKAQGYRRPCLVFPRIYERPGPTVLTLAQEQFPGGPGCRSPARLLEPEQYGLASGFDCCNESLAWPETPDVWICADDEIAFGVIDALNTKGLPIPEHGIVGCGNFPASAVINPPLTTTEIPYRHIGLQIGRLLSELAESGRAEAIGCKFMGRLLVRGSTARTLLRSPAAAAAVRTAS